MSGSSDETESFPLEGARSRARPLIPFAIERQFAEEGYLQIAGVDEVGVGCLAGPVFAAAVVFGLGSAPEGVFDSKALSVAMREALVPEIHRHAIAYAVAHADVEEIDSLNIFHAARLAMLRAVQALSVVPGLLLVDGKFPIRCDFQQRCLVKGDQLSVSIAAASVLAKVARDRHMAALDTEYPGYGFAKHKGYGTVEHRKALQAQGPSRIHRKSFSWTPV